ncbi:MAG: glycosyltransferase family 39 protein [Bacteroidia bacterium]|nr:glycosyltransferase family 39 protein [Bacteroidia bacterium]MDW8159169.1 glycosyltransferase family 39 protein [Bacteroidia bacterium]
MKKAVKKKEVSQNLGKVEKELKELSTNNGEGKKFSFWEERVQIIFFILLSLICYGNTINHEYAVDDKNVIFQNQYTKKGIAGIKDLLTKDSFQGVYGDNPQFLQGGRYRPLSLVMFAIEQEIWPDTVEKPRKPHPGHIINVLLFTLCCIIIYRLLRDYIVPYSPKIVFLTTLLFVVHPIHTEAVANIKGRDEVLSMLFLMLTLYTSLKFVREKQYRYLLISLVAFFLGLLSKENGLTFIAILPLTLYFFVPRLTLRQILNHFLPFLGVIVLYLILRISFTGLNLQEDPNDVLNNPFLNKSFGEKYGTIMYVLLFYIGLLFYPHPLSWDYSYKQTPYYHLLDLPSIASILLHVAALGFAIYGLRKRSLYSFSILFYLFSIFIVSNILINIGGFLGERFLFQASLGFFLLFVKFLVDIEEFAQFRFLRQLGFSIVVIAILSVPCIAKTISRNQDWYNNKVICLKDTKACPNSAKINAAAGNTLIEIALGEKDSMERIRKFKLAAYYLGRAAEILPSWIEVYKDYGMALAMSKQYEKAERAWLSGIAQNPSSLIVRDLKANLSILYYERAVAKMSSKNNLEFLQAEPLLLKSLEYNPQNEIALDALGKFYFLQKDYTKAILYFKKAVALRSENHEFYYNLGAAYLNSGYVDSAQATFERILRAYPQHAGAQQGLAIIKNRNKK